MNEHYIDKRFREELQGLEANPPVEAWLAVSDAIDHGSANERNTVLIRTAAAVGGLIVAAFSFWMLFLNDNMQEDGFAHQTIPSAMDPLPANQIPGAFDSGKLLADLTTTSLHSNYPSIQLTPVETGETEMPLQLKSYSAYLQGNTQLVNTVSEQQRFHLQTRLTYPETEVDFLTFTQDKKAFGTNIIIGAHFAPQYNYRTFADHSGSDYRSIPFSSLESQIYTYSAGLNVGMQLSPSWSIQTGVHLNNMGQFIEGIAAYQHPEYRNLYSETRYVITSLGGIRIHDNSHHYADQVSYRVIDTKESLDPKIMDSLLKSDDGLTQVFQFVEVPLLFRYKVAGKNIGLHLKGGVAGSYLLTKDVFLGNDITQNPIGETHGIQQFNFSVVGGFAMQLPVTGRFSLHMEPTAQIFLQPFVIEGMRMGSVLPYNFSLQTGFSYRF